MNVPAVSELESAVVGGRVAPDVGLVVGLGVNGLPDGLGVNGVVVSLGETGVVASWAKAASGNKARITPAASVANTLVIDLFLVVSGRREETWGSISQFQLSN